MAIVIKLNFKGIGDLLRDPKTTDLAGRAARIREATGSPEDFAVDVTVGTNRAHAVIRTSTPEGMVLEARDRVLTRAIDAGR